VNQKDTLIDEFVAYVNSIENDALDRDELPESLQVGVPTEYGQYHWQIKKRDLSKNLEKIHKKLPKKLPPSYCSFISRYAFPGFEVGGIFFFGNTGENSYWELSKRLFADSYMSDVLLKNGFIQFGNPYETNYNPVCFDTRNPKNKSREFPIVELDHEWILIHSKIVVVKEISTSFPEFMAKTKHE